MGKRAQAQAKFAAVVVLVPGLRQGDSAANNHHSVTTVDTQRIGNGALESAVKRGGKQTIERLEHDLIPSNPNATSAPGGNSGHRRDHTRNLAAVQVASIEGGKVNDLAKESAWRQAYKAAWGRLFAQMSKADQDALLDSPDGLDSGKLAMAASEEADRETVERSAV